MVSGAVLSINKFDEKHGIDFDMRIILNLFQRQILSKE